MSELKKTKELKLKKTKELIIHYGWMEQARTMTRQALN